MARAHPVIKLSRLLKPYAGKWVALSADESKVVGSGHTVEEAIQRANEQGEVKPIVIKSPDPFSAFLL